MAWKCDANEKGEAAEEKWGKENLAKNNLCFSSVEKFLQISPQLLQSFAIIFLIVVSPHTSVIFQRVIPTQSLL